MYACVCVCARTLLCVGIHTLYQLGDWLGKFMFLKKSDVTIAFRQGEITLVGGSTIEGERILGAVKQSISLPFPLHFKTPNSHHFSITATKLSATI